MNMTAFPFPIFKRRIRQVLLLKIGPGKMVLFLNNRTQIINSLKKTVFQGLHTLKAEKFEFRVKI